MTSSHTQPVVAAPSLPAASASPMPLPEDMRDDVYKLPDGRAFVLRWPSKLTADEYEDFEAWISLLQRKLKRQIEPDQRITRK